MSNRLWILGASDPEMAAIERLLVEAGERVAYAIGSDGERVHPGNAYRACLLAGIVPPLRPLTVYLVECAIPGSDQLVAAEVVSIDHHRPGDPGYGRPPEEFLTASSIGQVYAILCGIGGRFHQREGHWWLGQSISPVPSEIVLCAAADHCLEAAYRGRCPGVDPDALMRWRAESRAAFQGRTVEAVMADVQAARERLRDAIADGGHRPYADLRGESIPELPEAAAREGIPFLATVKDRDGRTKTVLQAANPKLVRLFLDGYVVGGLVDCYGDPERGFAGGYNPQ